MDVNNNKVEFENLKELDELIQRAKNGPLNPINNFLIEETEVAQNILVINQKLNNLYEIQNTFVTPLLLSTFTTILSAFVFFSIVFGAN